MGTLPQYQRKGLSSALLKTAFPIIKNNLCSLIWCNAREEAVKFYEKVGFERSGDKFEIPNFGTYSLMVKKIQ